LTLRTFVFGAVLFLFAGPGCGFAQQRHFDPALETLLPRTLGGKALIVESQAGQELASENRIFDAFLLSLGKSRADFSLASAYAGQGLKAAVGAWRVSGAEPAALLTGFRNVMQASSRTKLTITEELIANRNVTRIGDPGQIANGSLYVILKGDILLFVQTPDRKLAEEAIGKLPPS
jgi:hypothetical protein